MPSMLIVVLPLALAFGANAARADITDKTKLDVDEADITDKTIALASVSELDVDEADITDKDCTDIIPNSEKRKSAWRKKRGCKCIQGSLIAGDADECIKLLGQRYFARDPKLKGLCACEFALMSVDTTTLAASTDNTGASEDEVKPILSSENLEDEVKPLSVKKNVQSLPSWDCADYNDSGLEAGDLVRIKKNTSKWHNTVHIVTCPKSRTRGTKGRVCLRQGYKSSGCWGTEKLEKVMDVKVDSFQGALRKFTGSAELSLANFYQATSHPGAWDLDNVAPTLYNLAGVAANFGRNPPPEAWEKWWETQTCDAKFKDPIGIMTLGLSYDRRATVDGNVKKLVGDTFGGALGHIVRSDLVAGQVGATYEAINKQLTGQVPDKVKGGLADRFFDVAETGKRSSRHSKEGLVLIEFKVCKVSSQVRFFQCHIGGSVLNDSDWIGRGTFGDFLATKAWRLVANIPGLGHKLNPIIMDGIKKNLPAQVMNGLVDQVGGANVCLFPGGLNEAGTDRTQELFKDLLDETKCPQRVATGPPPLPKGCMKPEDLPADNRTGWWFGWGS